jgi:hypothetical protein
MVGYYVTTVRILGEEIYSHHYFCNPGRLIYIQDKRKMGNTEECKKVRITIEEL